MSTHAIAIFHDDQHQGLHAFYVHSDGTPQGFGLQLAEWLDGFVITDGLPARRPPKIANGIDDLAAQAVAHFKTGPGNVYLCEPHQDRGATFAYDVFVKDEALHIAATFIDRSGRETEYRKFFDGAPAEYRAAVPQPSQ